MPTARNPLYRRHRFPPEVISHAVWLYFRFPLSLRMVEEMLAERGICVSYETVRQWAMKFGEAFSDQIRQRAPARGDKWHLDEVVISIAGEPYWLWRAVRSKRLRARRSGSASKRQRRGAPAHDEAPQARPHAAARHDHRQAPILRRGAGKDGPSRRASPAQRTEQSGRELSPADKATGADYEALQISSTGATVLVGSRSDREYLPRPLSRIHNRR